MRQYLSDSILICGAETYECNSGKNWKVVSFLLCDSTDIESAIFSSFKVSLITDRVEVCNEYLSHTVRNQLCYILNQKWCKVDYEKK